MIENRAEDKVRRPAGDGPACEPVPTGPEYFAHRRGVTWLNMISDQAVGLVGKVISGTPRDTLHLIDLVYNPDGGRRAEVLITD